MTKVKLVGYYEKHNGGNVRHREPAKQKRKKKRNRKTSKRKKKYIVSKAKTGEKNSPGVYRKPQATTVF